jgi:hypothetical protein
LFRASSARIDLVTGAKWKVRHNPNCGIEYMEENSAHGNASTMRTYRRNKKAAAMLTAAKKKTRKSCTEKGRRLDFFPEQVMRVSC